MKKVFESSPVVCAAAMVYVDSFTNRRGAFVTAEHLHERVVMLKGADDTLHLDILAALDAADLLTPLYGADCEIAMNLLAKLTNVEYDADDTDEVYKAANGYVVLHVSEFDSCVIYLINYK